MTLPPFFAVAAAGLAFALAQGLSYPLLAVLQEGMGYSEFFIGVSAAMTPLGLLVASPFMPRLLSRFPARQVVLLCCAGTILVYLAMGLIHDPYFWMLMRFVLGFILNPIFMMAEVWTLSLAPKGQHGRYVAALSVVMQVGFTLGPATLAVMGEQGFAPFGVAIVAFFICAVILAAARDLPEPSHGIAPESPFRMILVAPVLLAAVAVTAGFEQGALSLLPIYAGEHGYSKSEGAWLLTVLIAGSIAMSPLAGWLAEQYGARRAMIWTAGFAALGAPCLTLLIGTWAVWPYMAIWGGVYFGIYTLALVEAGERFQGPALVALNASIGIMWGIGGLAGGPAAGGGMDWIGPEALPGMFTLLFGALAVAAWLRARQRVG